MTSDAPVPAAVALGANLGDRAGTIRAALGLLGGLPGTRVVHASDLFETPPVGPGEQGLYLNAAAVLETTLAPQGLLDGMLEIERALGRNRARAERWGPRVIDLDLLLYGGATLAEPGLQIPHPRMHERAFVLVPLAQVAGDWTVPGTGRTVGDLARGADARGIVRFGRA
ncbi:MAG: 2-amino-4-hydroxy-6-hydroxymethyldihydropteridine diphosphokinase [Leptolyngbya sp. PLA1]|nr:2-amino-4-hydroxy-6-hydroxymethyldihydropteridine diphosphokinase [Leptolyngbya sp. PLA1]